MKKSLFIARSSKGGPSRDGEWPLTSVSGVSKPDATGKLRIDLGIRDLLIAITERHLRVDLSEQQAVSLAQTITAVSDRLVMLRELHQKGKLKPDAYVEAEDDPPVGVPLIALSSTRDRELLWDAPGHVKEIRQRANDLLVVTLEAVGDLRKGKATIAFSDCRLVALRPLGGKRGLHVRLYKLNGSPFLMLATEPELLSHYVIEIGDEDVCDVIAASHDIQTPDASAQPRN